MTNTEQRFYAGRSAAQRRADRRQKLLDGGLELFGTHGYAATSVARLAKAAGLSTRQFYEEFTDREALLTAVYDRIHTDASAVVADALRKHPDDDFAQRLPRLLGSYLAYMTSDLRRAKVAFVEIIGVSQAVERHRLGTRQRWADTLTALLTDAVARGQIQQRDFTLATAAFIGAVNGMLQDWTAIEPRPPIQDVIDELVRLVLHGLVD